MKMFRPNKYCFIHAITETVKYPPPIELAQQSPNTLTKYAPGTQLPIEKCVYSSTHWLSFQVHFPPHKSFLYILEDIIDL